MENTKKKTLPLIVCGVIVLVAVAAMVIFILTVKEPESEPLVLDGAWQVVSHVDNGVSELPESEFILFDGDEMRYYKNNSSEPFASSKYSVDAAQKLKLPDLSREYQVDRLTDQYIQLHTSLEVYMCLVRCPNEDMSPAPADPSILTGRWKVSFRHTQEVISEEYLVFENDTLTDYRNGSEEPTLTAPYVWQGDHIVVESLGMEMVLKPISDTSVALVETANGMVWELEQAG